MTRKYWISDDKIVFPQLTHYIGLRAFGIAMLIPGVATLILLGMGIQDQRLDTGQIATAITMACAFLIFGIWLASASYFIAVDLSGRRLTQITHMFGLRTTQSIDLTPVDQVDIFKIEKGNGFRQFHLCIATANQPIKVIAHHDYGLIRTQGMALAKVLQKPFYDHTLDDARPMLAASVETYSNSPELSVTPSPVSKKDKKKPHQPITDVAPF